MSASPVRPEFGPTLPELMGRRFGISVRAAGILLGLVFAAILAGGIARHERSDGTVRAIVKGPTALNLRYDPAAMQRAAPRAGEVLRLQTPPGARSPASLTVRGVRLAPYVGDDPSIALPVFLTKVAADMQKADPHFVEVAERPARVNSQPGYQIQFKTLIDGRRFYGRRAFLFPDPREQPGARDGADITLLAAWSKVVAKVDDVGSNGPTKIPYRSFRLGATPP